MTMNALFFGLIILVGSLVGSIPILWWESRSWRKAKEQWRIDETSRRYGG